MYTYALTVETGNEFSISKDEKTDNYELNVARHAFSCSMRLVCLYSCMRSTPWLYKKFFDISILFVLLGFPTWAQNGVTFATCCSYSFLPPLCTTLTNLFCFFMDDVYFVLVSV
jgi:hypothetical protein